MILVNAGDKIYATQSSSLCPLCLSGECFNSQKKGFPIL
jgi:hypothetical protein